VVSLRTAPIANDVVLVVYCILQPYIHYNPVKHDYVRCVADWQYSSFHDFVKRSNLPVNWVGGIYPELDLA